MDLSNIDETALQTIADIVYDASGIVFKDSNLTVLISRLSSKLKEKNIDAVEYLRQLKSDKNELMSFIDFVTTNFTSFFRSPKQFEILQETILPQLVKSKEAEHNKTIKIWSAGCSTGEEAYTISIAVREFFEDRKLSLANWDIQIFGSDISLESLFIAKEGKYPARSVQKIDPKYLNKYFIPIEDGKYYIIHDDTRNMVKFDFHNLIYDSIFRNVDIAFCRNVIIYFDEDIQKKVMEKIHDSMNPQGILFLGHSESLVGLYDGFKPQSLEKGIIYARQ